jgi:hypothetical protein
MSTRTPDYEIGDSVVFGRVNSCDNGPFWWKDGRVIDTAGNLLKIEFRSFFGFLRQKWIPVTSLGGDNRWRIHRKERADELVARYQTKP